jgi:hypothetical protein
MRMSDLFFDGYKGSLNRKLFRRVCYYSKLCEEFHIILEVLKELDYRCTSYLEEFFLFNVLYLRKAEFALLTAVLMSEEKKIGGREQDLLLAFDSCAKFRTKVNPFYYFPIWDLPWLVGNEIFHLENVLNTLPPQREILEELSIIVRNLKAVIK